MNGTRLSVCLPGAGANTLISAARLAERFNLGLWIGAPSGNAPHSDDSYVTAATASVAGVTSAIPLGMFLTLRGSAEPLRLAEDIGVVDQASGGRTEIAFVAPSDGLAEWEARVVRLLKAWHEWPAGPDKTVVVSPGPAQAWISRLVAGPQEITTDVADRLRGGVVVPVGDALAQTGDGGGVPRRTVVTIAPEVDAGGIVSWLSGDPYARIETLRAEIDRLHAHEALIVLEAAGPERLVRDIEALGTVVAPGLRCSPHQAATLVSDAWNWLT